MDPLLLAIVRVLARGDISETILFLDNQISKNTEGRCLTTRDIRA